MNFRAFENLGVSLTAQQDEPDGWIITQRSEDGTNYWSGAVWYDDRRHAKQYLTREFAEMDADSVRRRQAKYEANHPDNFPLLGPVTVRAFWRLKP